jgi:tetratricopeptide (TPR) repeat protein
MPADQSAWLRAFTFGGSHYLVNSANEFPAGGEMGGYVQVCETKDKDLAVDRAASVLLEIHPAELEEAVLSLKTSLAEARTEDGTGLDIGPFSLASLKPGYYEAELSLADRDGEKLLTSRQNFVLLAQAVPVLPWVYAKTHEPWPNAEHLFLLAFEYFQIRQYDEALRVAEEAIKLKEEPKTRLLMARILLALGRFQDSLEAARPLYEEGRSREAAKILAAGRAGLNDWTSALIYLEELLAGAAETAILNLAAECYLNLNQPERALPLLRRSLEIDPDQPAAKALEERAKKKLQKEG